MGTHLAKILIS